MKTRHLLPLFALAAFPLAASAEEAEPSALQTIHSQPSWMLSTPEVELAITETGGMMAPVVFHRNTSKPVQPYYISPWQDEKLKITTPVLTCLRGDFFCLPFGSNTEAYNREKHPAHGEVTGGKWQYVTTEQARGVHTLRILFETKVRPGRVVKDVSLIEGQNVVYTRDVIEGFAGPTSLGHHATLAMPDKADKEGVFQIATSPMKMGMTNPGVFSIPAQGEYQSFMVGASFNDLTGVPLIFRDAKNADLTRLPARRGFADLLQLCNEKALIGWVTATRIDEGWLWFSLKNPEVLNSTVMWIENHGRHESPWNGRNNCLGLEDVCAFFADGLAASVAPNVLSEKGIQTSLTLKAGQSVMINYIQGVAKVPAGFDGVSTVDFGDGSVTFISLHGQRVTVPVRHDFLRTGTL
jgi:hypothetical protein